MDVFEALYTTRAMRRVRPDPIPMDVQKQILDAAVRAPTGGNTEPNLTKPKVSELIIIKYMSDIENNDNVRY